MSTSLASGSPLVPAMEPHVAFGTKAETLERVAPHLAGAEVLPLYYFSTHRWLHERDAVVDGLLRHAWSGQALIVRSSRQGEDAAETQEAGRYLTLAGVRGVSALESAVDAVIASFDAEGGEQVSPEDQVLVQPLLVEPRLSGVVFTRDPSTGAPYSVFNYGEDGDPAAVTSGKPSDLRTQYVSNAASLSRCPPALRPVLELCRQLERLCGNDAIDVEFAVSQAGVLYLLQVRPLPVRTPPVPLAQHRRALDQLKPAIAAATSRHPFAPGARGTLGVMPDWNPAEIIGTRPRPLAVSLYRHLLTDRTWATQRWRYGYRDMRGFPLLLELHGLPYIDVRASLASLVPAGVEPAIAERIVERGIDTLAARPELHDKVEFELAFSSYSFSLDRRLKRQMPEVLTPLEQASVVTSLRELTNRLMRRDDPMRAEDLSSLAELDRRLERTVHSGDLDVAARVHWLLDDCRRYGAAPFAAFARLAFVAVELLRSLVDEGVLSPGDVARLMASLDTVSQRMEGDAAALSRESFLERYGHLRPGTYDICSPRYDEAPDLYFDWPQRRTQPPTRAEFALTRDQRRRIDALMREHGLEHDARELLGFIRDSIELRENSKFGFTRHLSEGLRAVGELGARSGLTLEDCSYLDVATIDRLATTTADPAELLAEQVATGRRAHAVTRRLRLPPLITHPDAIESFELPVSEPTFVTERRVTGPVALADPANGDLAGRILLIESGDPGYDWIFLRGIAGFVTKFGGANSHMAVRAHQFQIPAVIGAGEALFGRCSGASVIDMDCPNRRVEVVR